jgi:hypothetical protein
MTETGSFIIDPQAKLDYGFDWSTWLATGDTIATSTWAITSLEGGTTTPTLSQMTFDDTTTTVWVEGATAGDSYNLTNSITTIEGRRTDATIILRCHNT